MRAFATRIGYSYGAINSYLKDREAYRRKTPGRRPPKLTSAAVRRVSWTVCAKSSQSSAQLSSTTGAVATIWHLIKNRNICRMKRLQQPHLLPCLKVARLQVSLQHQMWDDK